MHTVQHKGHRLSALALGTVQFGMPYGIANRQGLSTFDDMTRILDLAVGSGINCLDTAHAYGESEQRLGKWLRLRPANYESVVVTSKVAYTDAERQQDSTQLECIVHKRVLLSLQRLGISSLPYLLVHQPEDAQLAGGAMLEALAAMRQAGHIKTIGVSVYSPEELESALDNPLFGAVQIPFSVLDQRLLKTTLLQRSAAQDVLVYARSVFLQGLLLMQTDNVPPHLQDIIPSLEEFVSLCNYYRVPPHEAALKFPTAFTELGPIVIGVDSVPQLSANLKAFDGRPLAQDFVSALLNAFGNMPSHLLNPSLWSQLASANTIQGSC